MSTEGQPIPQDALMAALKTRGFTSGGGTPLRYFRGRMAHITGAMVQRGSMAQAALEVTYTFNELEVYASIEPYPFPTGQVSIFQNNGKRSGMGVLGKSIDKIVNVGTDENALQTMVKNQDFLVGKLQEWRMTDGHMMPSKDDTTGLWHDVAREAWELQWLEGIGGTAYSGVEPAPTVAEAPPPGPAPAPAPAPAQGAVTPMQEALNKLDGLTQQAWNNIIFQNPIVKADAALTQSIIDGTFLAAQIAAGTITVDENGVHHLPAAG